MKLHEFQRNHVELILSLPEPRKLWVLDETGLGKSVTAIAAAKELQAERVLVCTLGMVRPGWLERFSEWWPDRAADVGSIAMGPNRKAMSKPARERLEHAYSRPIQVTSYDLLPYILPVEWDLIVLDEMHELVSGNSATFKRVRDLFEKNPNAAKFGLSATPITAEPANSWNLIDLFYPGSVGKARPGNKPPYRFLNRFCQRIENDHGVMWAGTNPDHVEQFAELIGKISVRTLRSDVAHLLPPIDCSPLIVELGNKKTNIELAVEWADTASKESSHVSIFTYYRESAEQLAARLKHLPRYRDVEVACVTGDMTPEARHAKLMSLRDSKRAILVGTMDSLGVGISLTAFKQYLITEVTSTANQLVQLIGRFSRLDSGVPCRGFVMLREGQDDDKVATLRRRLSDFDSLIRAGQGERSLLKLLDQPLQGEAFDRRLDDLIATFRGSVSDDEEQEVYA